MDVNQASLMQMQIKNNAEDLNEFMKGLESWEDEIKEKDRNLSKQKPILKEHLPPVRNRKAKEHKRKKRKVVDQKPVAARINSYDYRSWDKFDVEKACEEVDYQVQSSSSSYESSTDEEEEGIKKKQQAIIEKEKGNEHFKKCAYELAVESYAKAMELDSTNAVLPANRAMALLKLERYAAAELDCTSALELDNTYLKAYLRRATARKKLKKFAEARQDFEAVLKIEQGNKLALTELEKLDKEVGTSGMRYIRVVKRPPHLRSKKPLKRVVIEDIGMDSESVSKKLDQPLLEHTSSANPDPLLVASTSEATMLPTITATEEAMTGRTPAEMADAGAMKPKKPDGQQMVEEVEPSSDVGRQSDVSMEDVSAQRDTVVARESIETTVASNKKTKMDVTQVAEHTGIGVTEGAVRSGDREDAGGHGRRITLPPIPTTSVQFQADWKNLKRDRNVLIQYFKAIPLSKYPVLLQQSLETFIFEDIIAILHQEFVRCGVPCVESLTALTKVQRFSVAVMFLSKQQKESLLSLFKDLLELVEDGEEKERVSALAKEFSINIT